MVSFYPGPSQLYPQVKNYMIEAYDCGILSKNHRSPDFIEMSQKTILSLKNKLNIPKDYTVFFTSSATECWEVLGQSFIDLFSLHIYNGAFGEKWYQYRRKLSPNAAAVEYSIQKTPSLNKLKNIDVYPEVICLTQNETSNGTQLKNRTIKKIKSQFPDSLLFVDATSSMGGVALDWLSADVWYASVQKCFGLPAGMAVMVCSKKAVEKAKSLNNNQHYNSMVFMSEKMENWQTTYTPNILTIFLLGKMMEEVPTITETHRILKQRKLDWEKFFSHNAYSPLIVNSQVRSDTVFAIKTHEKEVENIRNKAEEAGFTLGKGYGKWKKNTFRIANFPAIEEPAITQLKEILKNT